MLRKFHLNFIITLLTLVLCMGVLCNYSKASYALPDNIETVIEDDLSNYNQVTTQLQSYYSTIESFAVNVVRLEYSNYVLYLFFPSNFIGLANGGNSSYQLGSGITGYVCNVTSYCPISTQNNTVYNGQTYMMQLVISSNYVGIYQNKFSRDSSGWWNWTSHNNTLYDAISPYSALNETINLYYRGSSANYFGGGSSVYSNGTNSLGTGNFIGALSYSSNEDIYIEGSTTYTYKYANNWEEVYPSAIEDDRLSIYTLESNNGKQLNIDISAFRSYTPAAFYNFSDIDLILNCDGSEVSYTLDSNNSNIIDIWSSLNNVYTVQTLYSYFDLDSYEDVYISEVDFTLTVTSPGGTGDTDFQIACQYYLKKTHESMEPVLVPDPEYNNTEIYNSTQINNIKQDLHEYSSRFSFLSGTWNFVLEQDLPDFPGWATVYQNYVWFADGNSDTTYQGHWFQMANNIPSLADLTRPFDPSEFLEQNKTFAFYDVILLKVFTVEVLSGSSVLDTYDLAGYLVFISDRYYDHYNARLNLDILTQLQLSAENSVMFFDAAKARLDGIASDLDTGFNGLLDTSIGTQYKIISWLQTINDNMSGSFISLSNTLSDGFSSVVSAINNITPGGSSYSLPALSDALSYLFTPTLEWSAINYDDYEESLGVLALPFQFTFDVLDIAQNQYDPHFKLHLNELSLDVPLEAGENPDMTNFTVIEDQDIEQDPLDVIPSGLWTTLQYLNAFGLVMVQALSTYNHIFRR